MRTKTMKLLNDGIRVATLVVLLILWQGNAQAQDSAPNLNKELHNPLTNLKEVFYQIDALSGVGDKDKTATSLSIEPLYPFDLVNDWRLVTYSIFPLISQPGMVAGDDRKYGLGDTRFYGYFVPPDEEGLLWGFGPSLQIPTHTDDALGNDKWAAGPALIVGAQPGNWSLWALFDNIWSFAGSGETINEFSFQYQVVYLLPEDWFLISNWTVEADWEETGDERWTVPLGGGFGRQFKIGSHQFQLYTQMGYNVEAPDDAAGLRGILTLTQVF
jgi:hypothetical protein